MAENKGIEGLEIKKPEPPKPVVEKIPEGILKIITDLKVKKGKLINQFLNISFQLAELQDKQKETKDKVKNTNEQIGQKVKYAFDKLRLKKRKNYRWSYNGGDSFIGNLVPEKPKKK